MSEAQGLVASVPHWHHRFEIAPGVLTPGTYTPHFMWDHLNLTDRCRGKRVLDIGASDGFFSKSLAEAGAEVVSVDYRRKQDHGFGIMERLSGRRFDYRQMNVYDLTPERLGGTFDIVLFLGVLYHLPDMILALKTIRALCSGTMFLETLTIEYDGIDAALATYHRGDTCGGDVTNFWSTNRRCVIDMLHDASFDVVREQVWPGRILVETNAVYREQSNFKMGLAYATPKPG